MFVQHRRRTFVVTWLEGLSIKLPVLLYHIPCRESLKGKRGSSQDGKFTLQKLNPVQPLSRNV